MGYASARFKFSMASSICSVFLYPTVTQSTPALLNANLIAAWRSSRVVNALDMLGWVKLYVKV